MRWQRWLIVALAILLLYLARRVLPPFIVAGVIAYVLSPLVDLLVARGVPRRAAGALLFCCILAPLVVGLAMLLPGLMHQTRELLGSGPDLIENVLIQLTGGQVVEVFGTQVTARSLALRVTASIRDALGRPADAFHAAEQAVELVGNVLLTLLATFYFLIDGPQFGRYALRLVPPEQRPHVLAVGPRIHRVLGRYLGGQVLLVALMSAVTFVVLYFVFHLRFALPIAIATGFLEIIPVIGPITAGAIACVVALSQGGVGPALGVALAYFILRQVEDQFVMPQVVGRAVELHPLVTIFAVLTGGAIAGILGMVLAVPAAASIKVVLDYAYPPATPAEAPRGEPEPVGSAPASPSSHGQVITPPPSV